MQLIKFILEVGKKTFTLVQVVDDEREVLGFIFASIREPGGTVPYRLKGTSKNRPFP